MIVSELPLRERKKELIRRAILENAEHLFEAHGYDQVTVAQIADAANVSVKTLFTYFRSKEDLLFQDTSLIDTVLEALRARSKGCAPAVAVADALIGLLGEHDSPINSLGQYHRAYGEAETLRSRLLRLWADYEDIIAGELARESGVDSPTADIRFAAAELVILIRSFTWVEVRELAIQAGENSTAAIETWLQQRTRDITNVR